MSFGHEKHVLKTRYLLPHNHGRDFGRENSVIAGVLILSLAGTMMLGDRISDRGETAPLRPDVPSKIVRAQPAPTPR